MANGKRLGKRVKTDLAKHFGELMGVYGFPNLVEALRTTLDETVKLYPMHAQWQWALKALSQAARSDAYEADGRLFAKEISGTTITAPSVPDVLEACAAQFDI